MHIHDDDYDVELLELVDFEEEVEELDDSSLRGPPSRLSHLYVIEMTKVSILCTLCPPECARFLFCLCTDHIFHHYSGFNNKANIRKNGITHS